MRTTGLILLVFLLAMPPGMCGREPAFTISICTVLRNANKYNGKMVRVRGNILRSEGEYDLCARCKGLNESGVTLVYPDEGPDTRVRFHLIRDAAFKKFEYYLEAEPLVKRELPRGVIGRAVPRRYCGIKVTAIGRFEAVSEEEALAGRGYGNLGASRFRLVLRRVLRPTAEACPPPPEPQVTPPVLPPPLSLPESAPPPPPESKDRGR
jgi:hypothetical protein